VTDAADEAAAGTRGIASPEGAEPFGLASLVLTASLLEALRKLGVIDADAGKEIMANASIYIQAFGADYPPEVEQQARRILEMVSKASAHAPGE
jgi:hypothetical protein